MPRPYTQDLRWIWLTLIMGLEIDEVSFLLPFLAMCKNSMQSVKSTQPLSEDHIAMRPHEELVIIELLLQHPENALSETLQEIYQETGSIYACSTLHYYLDRNNITRKKVMRYTLLMCTCTISLQLTVV